MGSGVGELREAGREPTGHLLLLQSGDLGSAGGRCLEGRACGHGWGQPSPAWKQRPRRR